MKELYEKLAYHEQREKELEESEARLRMAIESTDLGTWDYNTVNGDLHWSDECKKIYGVSPDETIDMEAFTDHIHADDKATVLLAIQNAMDPSGTGLYNLTYRIRRFNDNSFRWIKVRGKVYFKEKQAERFIGTVIDITDDIVMQEKTSHSEKLFRAVALNIPNSLIIVIDTNHRLLLVEGDLMTKMGFESKNYEGKHLTEIEPPERYEASKHLYERVLAGEKFSVDQKSEQGDDFTLHFVPLKMRMMKFMQG